jgi:hypothetical protein
MVECALDHGKDIALDESCFVADCNHKVAFCEICHKIEKVKWLGVFRY